MYFKAEIGSIGEKDLSDILHIQHCGGSPFEIGWIAAGDFGARQRLRSQEYFVYFKTVIESIEKPCCSDRTDDFRVSATRRLVNQIAVLSARDFFTRQRSQPQEYFVYFKTVIGSIVKKDPLHRQKDDFRVGAK